MDPRTAQRSFAGARVVHGMHVLLTALEQCELVALGPQYSEQLLDLNLLCQRDAAKLLDVTLPPEIHTDTLRNRSRLSLVFTRVDVGHGAIGDGTTTSGERSRRPAS